MRGGGYPRPPGGQWPASMGGNAASGKKRETKPKVEPEAKPAAPVRRRNKPLSYTPEQAERAIKLCKSGYSTSAIGLALGLPKMVVRGLLSKAMTPEERLAAKAAVKTAERQRRAEATRLAIAKRTATVLARTAEQRAKKGDKQPRLINSAEEDAQIAAWLAKHEPTREVDYGIHAEVVEIARSLANNICPSGGKNGTRGYWNFNGQAIKVEELYRRVNAQLIAQGLSPIKPAKAKGLAP